MFCYIISRSAIFSYKVCKSIIFIEIIKIGARLGLIAAPFFGLVLLLSRRLLFLALDRFAYGSQDEFVDLFWLQ